MDTILSFIFVTVMLNLQPKPAPVLSMPAFDKFHTACVEKEKQEQNINIIRTKKA